jgi:hypothetical protein
LYREVSRTAVEPWRSSASQWRVGFFSNDDEEKVMARGSKDKYTEAQKHKAEHIEQSYEHQGVPKDEAESRAWATVNKQSGGGDKPGGSGSTTSRAKKHAAASESAKHAAKTRQAHPRDTLASLQTHTKLSLLAEARRRDIAGRSSMSKAQLIEALTQ